MQFGVRTLEDVERIGRLGGAFHPLTSALFRWQPAARLFKAAAGIHPDRKIPCFPSETFPAWAAKNNLTIRRGGKNATRKIATFAGCTGKFLFPEVPKAVVGIFQHNGFDVYYPEQKCCGVAEHTYDLGEYLAHLNRQGGLAMDFHPVSGRMIYYPPCRMQFNQLLSVEVAHPVGILRESYSMDS